MCLPKRVEVSCSFEQRIQSKCAACTNTSDWTRRLLGSQRLYLFLLVSQGILSRLCTHFLDAKSSAYLVHCQMLAAQSERT